MTCLFCPSSRRSRCNGLACLVSLRSSTRARILSGHMCGTWTGRNLKAAGLGFRIGPYQPGSDDGIGHVAVMLTEYKGAIDATASCVCRQVAMVEECWISCVLVVNTLKVDLYRGSGACRGESAGHKCGSRTESTGARRTGRAHDSDKQADPSKRQRKRRGWHFWTLSKNRDEMASANEPLHAMIQAALFSTRHPTAGRRNWLWTALAVSPFGAL